MATRNPMEAFDADPKRRPDTARSLRAGLLFRRRLWTNPHHCPRGRVTVEVGHDDARGLGEIHRYVSKKKNPATIRKPLDRAKLRLQGWTGVNRRKLGSPPERGSRARCAAVNLISHLTMTGDSDSRRGRGDQSVSLGKSQTEVDDVRPIGNQPPGGPGDLSSSTRL